MARPPHALMAEYLERHDARGHAAPRGGGVRTDLRPYAHSPLGRKVLRSLVPVICPPDVRPPRRRRSSTTSRSRSARRRALLRVGARRPASSTYDLGALPFHRRRAHQLTGAAAERYFASWEHGLTPLHVQFARALNQLMSLSCYEQPEMMERDRLSPRAVDRRGHAAPAHRLPRRRRARRRRRSSRPIRCGPASTSTSSAAAEGACLMVAARPALHEGDAPGRRVHAPRHPRRHRARLRRRRSSARAPAARPVAAELAEAGFDVIVLEEGSYYQTRDFTADTSAMVRQLYRDGGATMAIGNPPIMFQEGRAVGGSTVINGGMSWRTPEDILERWRTRGPASTSRRDRSSRTSSASRSGSTSRRWTPRRSATTTSCSSRAPMPRAGRSSATCATRRTASARTAARSAARPARSRARSSATSRARCTSARASTPTSASIGSRSTASARPASSATSAVPTAAAATTIAVRAKLVVAACGAIHTPALLARSGFRSPLGPARRTTCRCTPT